jgi:hypothetical protein
MLDQKYPIRVILNHLAPWPEVDLPDVGIVNKEDWKDIKDAKEFKKYRAIWKYLKIEEIKVSKFEKTEVEIKEIEANVEDLDKIGKE